MTKNVNRFENLTETDLIQLCHSKQEEVAFDIDALTEESIGEIEQEYADIIAICRAFLKVSSK